MRVVIFGATGMVGRGVLLECLDSPTIDDVLVVGRRPLDMAHPKLAERIHEDFSDLSALESKLRGLDACFWCLGVSAAGLGEERYTEITYDYTMAAARVLLANNPELRFCFVSGAGADGTQKGRAMWARVKGKTENALRAMSFKEVVIFRPAAIRPMRGSRLRGFLYRSIYLLMFPFMPLLRLLGAATSTVEIGRAMIAAGQGKANRPMLTSRDINQLARTDGVL